MALVVAIFQGVDFQERGQGLESAGQVGRLEQGLFLRRLERQAHGQAVDQRLQGRAGGGLPVDVELAVVEIPLQRLGEAVAGRRGGLLGLIIGVSRLSSNWLIRTIATVYVEFFRNIPPLIVILFWYLGVLAALPNIRDAIQLGPDFSLSNRGIFMPRPIFGPNFHVVVIAFVLSLVIAWAVRRWAHARRMATGPGFPAGWAGLAIVVVLTGGVFIATGDPLTFEVPVKTRFNINGGWTITPEFASLMLALGVYTASFIGEIVRSGIMAVSHGQTEAARALGLRSGAVLRLVVLPQALRVIIPPLASEYLNITKNTSLAVAIGYADLVAVGNNVLNPTGQSIEVVAIWMAFYLGLSIVISLAMNWFNARIALTER